MMLFRDLMLDHIFNPAILVYFAGAFYVLGLLIIHQIMLRLMILAGTCFYLLYYFAIADSPLWEAIYISLMIGVANILGLIGLVARNSRLAIPAGHRDIYAHFSTLPPGDFRTLMRHGRRHVISEELPMTQEGATVNKLFYVISGTTKVDKNGDQFERPMAGFVGDVAYLTGEPASATTRLTAGSAVVEWSAADLRQASARSARFQLALDAALSLDLARKMATSVAPFEPAWRPQMARDQAP